MKASEYGVNIGSKRFFGFPFYIVLALLLTSFYPNSNYRKNDGKFTVVLDAGHGGHDPGNLGNGYLEKNIVLNIVLKAGALLEKHSDIKVIYTRKDDTFVDLYVRGEIANKAEADLFVSVHCDSHTSNAHGAGTFVLGLNANKQNFEIAKKENSVIYLEDDYKSRYADYDINSPESVIGLTIMQEEFLDQSIALAKTIQDNFANSLNRLDRKVKQAGFIVLHQTFMPSVLVETGFLTNTEEGAYLNSKKGQSQMGTAIAEALMAYKQNAMANVADFDAVAVNQVADPDSMAENEQRDLASNKSESNKEKSQKREKNKKALKRKETAQIIEEAESQAVHNDEEIVYKVQIMASAKNFPLRPESFNGLDQVAKEPIKDLFRYVYGSTASLQEAKVLKSNADTKGYPTSFIAVYRNGERISFREGKKYISGQ